MLKLKIRINCKGAIRLRVTIESEKNNKSNGGKSNIEENLDRIVKGVRRSIRKRRNKKSRDRIDMKDLEVDRIEERIVQILDLNKNREGINRGSIGADYRVNDLFKLKHEYQLVHLKEGSL